MNGQPIAYTYEADIHCPGCTAQRFGADLDMPNAHPVDREGNYIGAVFDWEVQTEDTMCCGDCGGEL